MGFANEEEMYFKGAWHDKVALSIHQPTLRMNRVLLASLYQRPYVGKSQKNSRPP